MSEHQRSPHAPLQPPLRVVVLGAGGLGRAAARIIAMKRELRLVGICDSQSVLFADGGLDGEAVACHEGTLLSAAPAAFRRQQAAIGGGTTATAVATETELAEATPDGIGALLEHASAYDGVIMTLPNLPNEFIPSVIRRFAERGTSLVFVDALKRTRAATLMFELHQQLAATRSVALTGCGATPGLLTTAAVLAAQSFIAVEHVKIRWGVGIPNWAAYNATIREDIAHLPGYTVERARAMSDEEIEALLDRTEGKLEFRQMEHADDLLLQRVGVVDSLAQVEVGGVMDTRSATKPVETTMTLTGITFDGRRSSHRFILGNETTMAANVIGPMLGYLKCGFWLKAHGIYGCFGSAEFLPRVIT